MIINDKALAKVLKRSGTTGFKMCVNGNTARLVSWDWAARFQLYGAEEPPKLTLAALVEMLEYIPGDGECGHIYKTKTGWEWQGMTEAVFDTDYNTLARREQSTLACVLLPIRYGGPLVLTLAGKMYRVTGPGSLAADMSAFCFKEPGSLCFGDADSELYISCQRPELPSRTWQQLEGIDWEVREDGV